jgi:hypothetical protein
MSRIDLRGPATVPGSQSARRLPVIFAHSLERRPAPPDLISCHERVAMEKLKPARVLDRQQGVAAINHAARGAHE